MKLRTGTRLALSSVLEFAARPGEHVPAGELAERFGASPHHLAKVLAELVRAGVVESVRGVGGGYRFIAQAKRLTLLDVIELFEPLGEPGNGAARGTSPVDRALAEVLDEIDQTAIATFASITIATALAMVRRHEAAGRA